MELALTMFLCLMIYMLVSYDYFIFFLSGYGTRFNHVLAFNDLNARFILFLFD